MDIHKLAIRGGAPLINQPAPTWPIADQAIRDSLLAAIDDGSWGKYESHWTSDLVHRLQTVFGCDQVQLCSSGTIAVELALRGVSVGPEDEVILAGYDFPGNFRAIEAIGAFPVLVDVVEDGWVLDAEQVESAISERTRAIIVSHLHGQIANIPRVREVVSAHNQHSENQISIVEDVCQVPGGQLDHQPLGSLGDVAALSFGGSKLLSAGRGGAVITRSPEILQRVRIFNSRGNEAFPMSQLQAAVLLPQLDQLPMLTEHRQRSAARLIEATAGIETLIGLKQIVPEPNSMATGYYKLPWILRDRTLGWSRSEFVAAAQAEGIPLDVGFRGFLRRTPRRCRKIGTLANSLVAAQQTLLLHHPILLQSDETINLVAQAIRKVATSAS